MSIDWSPTRGALEAHGPANALADHAANHKHNVEHGSDRRQKGNVTYDDMQAG
jgi:hypothetical protein